MFTESNTEITAPVLNSDHIETGLELIKNNTPCVFLGQPFEIVSSEPVTSTSAVSVDPSFFGVGRLPLDMGNNISQESIMKCSVGFNEIASVTTEMKPVVDNEDVSDIVTPSSVKRIENWINGSPINKTEIETVALCPKKENVMKRRYSDNNSISEYEDPAPKVSKYIENILPGKIEDGSVASSSDTSVMIPTTIDAMQKDDEYLEKFAELERRLNEPLPVPSKQVEITNLPESPENSGDNDEGNGDLLGDEDSKDNDQDYEVEERPLPIRTRPVKKLFINYIILWY